MDAQKIGAAIKTLRRAAGYTQQELADYLCVTDKAVSKWERGLSIPDIAIITELANILNADVDNLLEGNIAYLEDPWNGVLRLEEGLSPDTLLHGKPLAGILLSYFVLAGIRRVQVVGSPEQTGCVCRRFGDGSSLGMALTYHGAHQEILHSHRNTMIVYGNPFLFGVNLTRYFQRAISRDNGISILTICRDRQKAGQGVFVDMRKRLAASRKGTACDRLPVIFCPAKFVPALSASRSMDDLIRSVPVYAQMAGKGFVDQRILTPEDGEAVSEFLRLAEQMTGNEIYDLEAIAEKRGFLGGKK